MDFRQNFTPMVVTIVKTRCDKSINESFADSPREIFPNIPDVIDVGGGGNLADLSRH